MSLDDRMIGGTVALELVLGRSDAAVVWAPRLTAYPDGFALDVAVRTGSRDERLWFPFGNRSGLRLAVAKPPPIQLSVELVPSAERAETSLDSVGWESGRGLWRECFEIRPLPPPGLVVVGCSWPAAGIELTRTEIDPAPVREAAARSILLWREGP